MTRVHCALKTVQLIKNKKGWNKIEFDMKNNQTNHKH